MGNFASSSEWVQPSNNAGAHRQTITPCASLPVYARKSAAETHKTDIVSRLVANAIATCKQSIRSVLMRAIDKLNASDDVSEASTTYNEEDTMDEVFNEFQIVYEDNYAPKSRTEAPFFQYSPSDFETFETVSAATWNTKKGQHDDDCRSSTTEATEWLSESDDIQSENPASSSCSELDELDFSDDEDDDVDVETKAARLLRLASTIEDDNLLFVDDYICTCGKCPLYATIEDDVSRLVTWHGPEELISITRILQAFSTYNEATAYHPDMIATADELLRLWCGDEDQAFSSFVVLHDDVPFLCGSSAV